MVIDLAWRFDTVSSSQTAGLYKRMHTMYINLFIYELYSAKFNGIHTGILLTKSTSDIETHRKSIQYCQPLRQSAYQPCFAFCHVSTFSLTTYPELSLSDELHRDLGQPHFSTYTINTTNTVHVFLTL
jgi:hypothetical protein